MKTVGIIVFVVSGAVLFALPGLFLWMLWHTTRERRRWRRTASHEMGQTLEQERNDQAHRQRRRQERERERELRERRGGVLGDDGSGAPPAADAAAATAAPRYRIYHRRRPSQNV